MNKILESLYDDPGYTITELANIMKMSRKSISNNIKKLKDLGIIERVVNNKKGYLHRVKTMSYALPDILFLQVPTAYYFSQPHRGFT